LFQSYLTTALGSDEMVLEAWLPEQPGIQAPRSSSSRAVSATSPIVGVAASLTLTEDQLPTRALR
jgi:hypothetical protein